MTADIITWFCGWWTGSGIQVGIAVTAFWLALIVAILAIVSGNRMGDES
jgi:hypothetical protein